MPDPAPKGCPIIDPEPDKDGVPLPCDACPDEVGVKPDGCPIRDKDGDGIFDDKDKCKPHSDARRGLNFSGLGPPTPNHSGRSVFGLEHCFGRFFRVAWNGNSIRARNGRNVPAAKTNGAKGPDARFSQANTLSCRLWLALGIDCRVLQLARGFGSFDNTGQVRNVKVWAEASTPAAPTFFSPAQ